MIRLPVPSASAQRRLPTSEAIRRPASRGDGVMPTRARFAVIDLGSNSGRVIVVEPSRLGYLHVVAEAHVPLELTRALDEHSRLRPRACERVLAAMAEFVAIAHGAGAQEIFAVGTAALRRAGNARALLDEVRRRFAVEVEIIDGATEARYSFLGAAYALPVEDGLLVDIGGGSLEIVRFRARALTDSWSFPFGALRLTDEFVDGDPPSAGASAAIAAAVRAGLESAGVGRLASGEQLVGTGGTIRNLAKIDGRRLPYPIGRLHGYTLATSRARKLARSLGAQSLAKRREIDGLNPQRADSILAGAVTLLATMEHVHARDLIVSGQGLREGVMRRAWPAALPSAARVRHASLHALTRRMGGWDEARAERRAALAVALANAVTPDMDHELLETLGYAAMLLDVGAAIDFYHRHRETAAIVLRSDLVGFSHRQLAALAAIVQLADRPAFNVATLRPLVTAAAAPQLARAGTLLALADAIARRSPVGADIGAAWQLTGSTLRVDLPWHPEWGPEELIQRCAATLGLSLAIGPGDGTS